MITNDNVVSDLDLIIQNHAIANNGIVDCTTVHCGAGANFYIGTNGDTADLMKLGPPPRH